MAHDGIRAVRDQLVLFAQGELEGELSPEIAVGQVAEEGPACHARKGGEEGLAECHGRAGSDEMRSCSGEDPWEGEATGGCRQMPHYGRVSLCGGNKNRKDLQEVQCVYCFLRCMNYVGYDQYAILKRGGVNGVPRKRL